MMHSHRLFRFAAVAAALLSSAAAQQLVRDIEQSGAVPATAPQGFVTTTTFAAFAATTPDAGTEPWVTDGTAAGTFRLLDAVPGITGSTPQIVCEYQGDLLFTATFQSQKRLFRTDGTAAGTALVGDLGFEIVSVLKLGNGTLLINSNLGTYATDLTPAGTVQLPGMLRYTEGIRMGGVSFGWCQRTTSTSELWRTDGTPAGTTMLATLQGSLAPTAFTLWNGRVYFVDGGTLSNTWLSSTDGTDFVHHVLLPLAPGSVDRMHVYNNRLCFDRGGVIYTSDLTQSGTGFLSLPCADAHNLVAYGGNLYFRATTAANGYELWQTDCTVAGTSQVADLMPGSGGSHPEHFLPTANGLFFRALLPTGRHLMRLDTPASITDLGTIPNDAPTTPSPTSPISGFVPFLGGFLFAGTDAAGTELWSYDGQQPPARLADLVTDGPSLVLPANTDLPPAVAETQYFLAYEAATGLELYRTDGTAAGTLPLDLSPGATSTFQPISAKFARYGDRIAFASQNRVAITDGTVAGTQNLILPASSAYPSSIQIVDDELWFLRNGVVYRSNGTFAGTVVAVQAQYVTPTDFLVLAQHVLLTSFNDLYSAVGSGIPQLLGTTSYDHRMYRLGDDLALVVGQNGIVATDGTPAGTTQLTNVATPALGAVRNGLLYQLSYQDLWITDGTPAGTRSIPLPAQFGVSRLVLTAHAVFLVASTPATGSELFHCDVGTGQIALVHEFAPGPVSGVLTADALGVGDRVLVVASDDLHGVEPWITDGTSVGTHLLADINPGHDNSNPMLLGIAGATAYLFADDGVHGRELMRFPLGSASAASLQSYGQGCVGSAGIPHLTAAQVPAPGTSFVLHMTPVRRLTLCAIGFSTQLGAQPLGACELLLGGPIATVVGTSTMTGTADLALPLPNSAQLVGLRLAAQGFAVDGLVPGGFTASDGLIFVPGH